MADVETPFVRDGRGSTLARWDQVSASEGRHVLRLRGPTEIVVQLLASGAGYRPIPGFRGQPTWTHAVRAAGPLTADTRAFLDLLERAISLPVRSPLDFALALDWYKIPDAALDPREWPRTELGELVRRAKYWYQHDARRLQAVGSTVVPRVCAAIARHPVLRGVDLVADVPGHDRGELSFGSRIADSVSKSLGIAWLSILTRHQFRPEAKSMLPADRVRVLRNTFGCDTRLAGESVLLVDDVYQSGTSMSEVARVVKDAGASAVYGLSAVRTLRRG